MTIDLTVAVTAHAEDFLLRPTLRSVAAGLRDFFAAGHTCELLITLDRPSEWTRREALRWRDDPLVGVEVRVLEVNLGESGASRNAAAQAALGTYLAFVDGDDLVSRDFFTVAFDETAARSEPTVAHPEFVLSFGSRSVLWHVRSMDDASLSYRDLLAANLWPSCSFALRETFLSHPYPPLKPGSGFGPEDYAWNIATSGAGVKHTTASGTAFFYRVRDTGGVNNAHRGSILPRFNLDDLREAFPSLRSDTPPMGVPQPPRSVRVRRALISAIRPPLRWGFRLIPSGCRAPIRAEIARLYHLLTAVPPQKAVLPLPLRAALKEATELEPAISWAAFRSDDIMTWEPPDYEYADVLEALVDSLRGTDTLLLAPWLGIGGADMVTLNYAKALAVSPGLTGRVGLLTTYLPERTLRHLIPAEVRHVQLDTLFRAWPLERQQRLLAQAMVMLRPRLAISVNCFDLTNSLAAYSRAICAETDVYLTLFAFDRIGDGAFPVNPISDDPRREFLHDIKGIVSDNTVTASILSGILGVDEPFVRIHHQSADVPSYDFHQVVKQTAAFYDHDFSPERPFRVMWPHRLDKEKRPDVVLKIARRVRDEGLPMELHVFGQRVLENGSDDIIPAFTALGGTYHGAYSGGLPTLPTEEFHALLLTSESEGMPLVLAQALLLGLPVVASDVGGVGDLIEHRETGMLTSGPDDVEGFIDALKDLMESRPLRQHLIQRGHERASSQHGLEAFSQRVAREFGLQT